MRTWDVAGSFSSLGFNLVGVTNGSTGFGATGDQVGSTNSPLDAGLGPLQDNGGPTLTMAPLPPSSLAINGGTAGGTTTDQRGRLRPYGFPLVPNVADGSDIGAVEIYPPVTLVVSNNNNSGTGSLRQAIQDAAPGDTINFAQGIVGPIVLASELGIDKNISILGPAASSIIVSGNNACRLFHIINSVVNLFGLTITNGSATGTGTPYPIYTGGGILSSHSTLLASQCTVIRNVANIGGGIYNDHSSLALVNCLISGNEANDGAGCYNDGNVSGSATLNVTNCTFNGNFASYGGGIYNNADVGGNAALAVIASTLSGNSADYGAGILNDGGSGTAPLTILSTTLSGNSGLYGGLANFPTTNAWLMIGDSILKQGDLGTNIFNDGGKVTSLGYNLSSDSAGGDGTSGPGGFLNQPNDIRNTDPLLGPLQNNGGLTPTMLPATNSPALENGKNLAALATDQRGRCRIYDDPAVANAAGGDASDIGAVELSPPHTGIVTTNGDGAGVTLRYCICDAQPGDAITFAPNIVGAITLNGGMLFINKNLTIQGPGPKVLAIDGNAANLVYPAVDFYVSKSVATISGLTISNGNGGIYSYGSTLTVSNCNITGNTAAAGAGIYNNAAGGGTLTVVDSMITGNSANNPGIGGGIYNDGQGGYATLKLLASTISGNSATNGGGGIYNSPLDPFNGFGGGTATTIISNSTITANTAGAGGGIDNFGGTLDVIASTISANIATNNGGGILNSSGVESGIVGITNSTISGNTALLWGGGIYNNGGPVGALTLIAGTISSNVAFARFQPDGGVYNAGSFLEIGDTILKAGPSGPSILNASGNVLSDGYNLSSDFGGGALTNSTDQINTDPMLGPLQNNGGVTFTHALLWGSPAIDKGKSFGLTTDQRGLPRPFDFPSVPSASGGDGSDIGAFELNPPALSIAHSGPNVVLWWPDSTPVFRLQSVTNLAASNNWTAVSATASTSGGQNYVTNVATGPRNFYRLVYP